MLRRFVSVGLQSLQDVPVTKKCHTNPILLLKNAKFDADFEFAEKGKKPLQKK